MSFAVPAPPRRWHLLCLGLCLALLLPGCAQKVSATPSIASIPPSSNLSSYTPAPRTRVVLGSLAAKSYTVNGKNYRPYSAVHGYTEIGTASWYGPGFHGKKTSNGERFNQKELTAAHKLLPFGTIIRVTNLSNNRSTTVRINDRGPFVGDRIIDLSRAAAQQLDMLNTGTARVRIETEKNPFPILNNDGDLLGNFYVQIGSFRDESNASALMREVKEAGLGGRVTRNYITGWYHIQIGPYASGDHAQSAADRLKNRYKDLFVVAE